jgi:hypothetical protein
MSGCALGFVGVADCAVDIHGELAAIEDDFLVVYLLNGAQRNGEVTGILDINDDTPTPDLAHSAEGFAGVVREHIKAFDNCVVVLIDHQPCLRSKKPFSL